MIIIVIYISYRIVWATFVSLYIEYTMSPIMFQGLDIFIYI